MQLTLFLGTMCRDEMENVMIRQFYTNLMVLDEQDGSSDEGRGAADAVARKVWAPALFVARYS